MVTFSTFSDASGFCFFFYCEYKDRFCNTQLSCYVFSVPTPTGVSCDTMDNVSLPFPMSMPMC